MAKDGEEIAAKNRHRAWTRNAVVLSLVAHLVFVVIAAFVVALRPHRSEQPQFVSALATAGREVPRLKLSGDTVDVRQRTTPPALERPIVALSPSDLALPEITVTPKILTKQLTHLPQRPVLEGIVSARIPSRQTPAGGAGTSPAVLPARFSARCDAVLRTARLLEGGGSEKTEQAVVRALGWLQRTQNQDGSWGRHTGSMTGLALLAFLGHCETPSSAEFGDTVRRAIDYLVALGTRSGGDLAGEGGWPAYQHGIATYALAEAYAMTGEATIAPVLRQATRRIIEGQTTAGGWVYRYGSESTDMSVSSWQLQALAAVQLSGLALEGLGPCLDRATACLLKIQNPDGGFPYHPGGASSWTLTGAGVLGLQLGKHPDSLAVGRGIELITRWAKEKLHYRRPGTKLYGWYYNTLACYLEGGVAWRQWNRQLQEQLTGTQSEDGSWPEEGGGLLTQQAKQDAAHMRTCLCTLMLEVYYRYLPATS